jgi:sugar phosphate isomerase/epimerase
MDDIDRVGIERLCVFAMPPVEFVNLVADLDCQWIGIGLEPMREFNPQGYPDWSLKTDPALRRDMVTAMADRGVAVSLCEGFGIFRGVDVRDYAADLDIVRELGGRRINVTSSGRDLNRSVEGFAAIAEMAAEREIEVVIELGPGPIRDLTSAVTAVHQVGRPNFRVLLDTMHYFRFGGTVTELAAMDHSLIGYVQLCDVPVTSTFDTYMEEALYERLPPGEGELPLLDFLRLVPEDVVISLEIPQRARAEAGDSARQTVGHLLASTRALLAQLDRP